MTESLVSHDVKILVSAEGKKKKKRKKKKKNRRHTPIGTSSVVPVVEGAWHQSQPSHSRSQSFCMSNKGKKLEIGCLIVNACFEMFCHVDKTFAKL